MVRKTQYERRKQRHARRERAASGDSRLRHLGRRLRLEWLEDRRLFSITVNTLVDEADGNLADGDISLRDAIALAPAGTTIDFSPSLTAAGPATIHLTLGELAIKRKLSIVGPGANLLTLDAFGGHSRLFNIDDGTEAERSVSMSGLTLTGGISTGDGGAILTRENLTLEDCTLTGNSAGGLNPTRSGGAIHAAANTHVVINDSTISYNSVGYLGYGGGVSSRGSVTIARSTISHNVGGFGGGIFSQGEVIENLANVEVTDSTISGNVAGSGGGILGVSGGIQLTGCMIAGNSAAYGGGLYGYESTLLVSRSTISGNTADGAAGTGGGIQAVGVLVLSHSTVSGNSAKRGAGVFGAGATTTVKYSTLSGNSAAIDGGGLYLVQTDAVIAGSTVSGNSAGTSGGGLWIKQQSATVISCTIAGNIAGSAGGGIMTTSMTPVLSHTIVARNTRGPDNTPSDAAGSVALAFSLLGVDAGVTTLTNNGGNKIGTIALPIDPLLAPLADNGGATKTRALLAGSPAIDAGNVQAAMGVGGFAEFDQRGAPFLRIADGDAIGVKVVDIGAFELQPAAPVTLVVNTLVDELDGSVTDGDVSLRDAIAAAVPGATIEFATLLWSGGPATINLSFGQLDITKSLSILGPGATLLSIDATASDLTPNIKKGDGSRIFNVDDGNANMHKEVAIAGLTLTGGDAAGFGGAIRSEENLTLAECILAGNYASEGGGGITCSGSAILNTVTIANCTISGNSSGNVAGGIEAHGAVTVSNSTISGNSAAIGGAFFHQGNADRRLTVVDSVITGNTATSGGGFANGYMTIVRCTISHNSSLSDGGGINMSGADLILTQTVISQNTAAMHGGGIRLEGPASVTINDCEITGNTAGDVGGGILSNVDINPGLAVADSSVTDNAGGGILTRLAPLVIVGSTISGNAGSGVYKEFGSATIVESAIRNNTGDSGIVINSGDLTLTGSLVSGNSSIYDGGGVYVRGNATITASTISGNSTSSYGGGLAHYGGDLVISNSTISGNQAAGDGGGIYAKGRKLALVASTVVGNSADGKGGGIRAVGFQPVFDHAIVAGNTEAAGARSDVRGSVAAAFSLIGVDTEALITNLAGSLIGSAASPVDSRLGPLADNGGPTMPDGSRMPTHALLGGSPAINAGDPAAQAGVGATPKFDQRGAPFIRIYNGRLDMGAVEFQPVTLPADFNDDLAVDGFDFLAWQRGFGTVAPEGTRGGGDADYDHDVDDADFTVWQAGFGVASTPPQVAALTTEVSSAPLAPTAVDAVMAIQQGYAAPTRRRRVCPRVFRA